MNYCIALSSALCPVLRLVVGVTAEEPDSVDLGVVGEGRVALGLEAADERVA